MLSNVYFLAKFRFDTAENEPAQNLQKLQKFAKNLQKFCLGKLGPGGAGVHEGQRKGP